jgi:uncharacterized protein (TIGR00730 family)
MQPIVIPLLYLKHFNHRYMTSPGIRSVAVFCASKTGSNPAHMDNARALGEGLAKAGINIVYGGGGKGLMGAVADGHLAAGGRITGVIPSILRDREHQHQGLSELIVTRDMHERKRTIYERCDAAIILPGGFGTLDELFEMLTWNQLSIHDKRIFILNTEGFYDHLIAHLQHMEQEAFLYDKVSDRICVCGSPAALLAEIGGLKN